MRALVKLDPGVIRRALLQLGRVKKLEDLGTRGPLQAAVGDGSLYSGALFGRDTLLMALDLLDDFPAVAEATLVALAERQGTRSRKRSEEEPGRILHEHRYSQARRNPHWGYPYYGTVDANCLFARLVDEYVQRGGPGILARTVRRQDGVVLSVGDAVTNAVKWIENRLERHDFLYVQRSNRYGLRNQVWPDSYDAFYFEDGQLFDPELACAPVTVQGDAYDALLIGARLAPTDVLAKRWRARAERMRKQVIRSFWLPAERMFALALVFEPGGGTRASRVVASDAGHLLGTGLLAGDSKRRYREAIRDRLLAPDMLAGAGVRTKSVGAPRFNPGSYHNGSVWPMDTGIIADGLRQHGFTRDAEDLEDRILAAVARVRSPVEFFRGDTDGEIRINQKAYVLDIGGKQRTVEQTPQLVQGWTATRVWKIMRRRGIVG